MAGMESAAFRSSCEWTDDQRAAVLFSPFRDKTLNPHSWEKKMNFWVNATWECILIKHKLFWNLEGLMECFERKGKFPKCLDSVITEMIRTGKLQKMSDFEKQSSSWTTWGYDTFLKRPLLWGLSKVLPSTLPAEKEVFVIPELIKKKAADVMALHYSQVQHETADNIVELATLRKQCENLFENDTEFEVILKYLQINKQVLITKDKDGTMIVKFPHQLNTTVMPVKEIEFNIFRIQKVMKQLEHQIEILSQQSDACRLEARKLVSEKKKTQALHQLKKRRTLLRQIEKKSACADTLHAVMQKIEESSSNEMVVKAYESGLSAIRHMTGDVTVEKVDKVLDDLQQVLEDQEEISQALSNLELPGTECSQDDLETELDKLLAEQDGSGGVSKQRLTQVKVQNDMEDILASIETCSLNDLPDVPSGLPGSSSKSSMSRLVSSPTSVSTS